MSETSLLRLPDGLLINPSQLAYMEMSPKGWLMVFGHAKDCWVEVGPKVGKAILRRMEVETLEPMELNREELMAREAWLSEARWRTEPELEPDEVGGATGTELGPSEFRIGPTELDPAKPLVIQGSPDPKGPAPLPVEEGEAPTEEDSP